MHKFHPPYALEFILALYYAAFCVLAAVMFADWMMTGYCALMTLCFLAVSFGDYCEWRFWHTQQYVQLLCLA